MVGGYSEWRHLVYCEIQCDAGLVSGPCLRCRRSTMHNRECGIPMHRSLLQSFFVICATAALLLQHAPLAWIGGDGHFCTEQVCVCGNPHHHGEDHHHAAGHSNVYDSGNAGQSTPRATLQPCDSDPAGIITLTLDKFVPRSIADIESEGLDAPSSSSYTDLHDQLVVRQVFRPPVSTLA